MTRDRLIELIDAHISVAIPVGTEYANIHGIKFAADAILAEMAGEWNAALAEANDVLAMASVASSAEVKKFVVDACALIRALRRPDAAPARQSSWQHGDPRCDNCDNGQEKEWMFCPFCGHQTKFEDDYGPDDVAARPVPSPLVAASERILPYSAPFARPLQAGEVAEITHRLEALLGADRSTRAGRLHAILLVEEAEAIKRAADLLAAQTAEIEFLKGHQEGDAESIAALTAALAAKNAALQAIVNYIPPADPDKDPYTQIAAFAKRTARAAIVPDGKEVKP